MPKRVKIVTRDEIRALKKMLADQRRIIDVMSQRWQVVVSSLDCVSSMLEQYGVKRPAKGPMLELDVKTAEALDGMLDNLEGFMGENGGCFDANELKVRSHLIEFLHSVPSRVTA